MLHYSNKFSSCHVNFLSYQLCTPTSQHLDNCSQLGLFYHWNYSLKKKSSHRIAPLLNASDFAVSCKQCSKQLQVPSVGIRKVDLLSFVCTIDTQLLVGLVGGGHGQYVLKQFPENSTNSLVISTNHLC